MSIPMAKMRKQIDTIDKKIIDLLEDRMRVVKNIGDFKKINNIEPLDPARWQEVLATRVAMGISAKLSEELITTIWTSIH